MKQPWESLHWYILAMRTTPTPRKTRVQLLVRSTGRTSPTQGETLKLLQRKRNPPPKAYYRSTFLKALTTVLKGARRHTSYMVENTPVFDKETALREQEEQDRFFYDRFYDT